MTFPVDAWQNASTSNDDSNLEAPDPGPTGRATFEIELQDAKAFVSKAGNAVVVLEMRVLGGPLGTYTWTELRNFKSDGAIKATKATCHRLGVDVDNCFGIEDIDSQLKGCVGGWYEIEVVQNGEWRNVYVQGRAGRQPAALPSKDEAAEAMAAAAGEERVPWEN